MAERAGERQPRPIEMICRASRNLLIRWSWKGKEQDLHLGVWVVHKPACDTGYQISLNEVSHSFHQQRVRLGVVSASPFKKYPFRRSLDRSTAYDRGLRTNQDNYRARNARFKALANVL